MTLGILLVSVIIITTGAQGTPKSIVTEVSGCPGVTPRKEVTISIAQKDKDTKGILIILNNPFELVDELPMTISISKWVNNRWSSPVFADHPKQSCSFLKKMFSKLSPDSESISCPLPVGNHTVWLPITMDNIDAIKTASKGRVLFKLHLTNKDKSNLFCYNFDVTIN